MHSLLVHALNTRFDRQCSEKYDKNHGLPRAELSVPRAELFVPRAEQ